MDVKLSVLFVLAVMAQGHFSEAIKVLGLFPLPGKSHFATAEELCKLLAQKGHQVDVVSHFPQKKPLPNYRDISLAGTAPNPTNNLSFSETQNFGSFSLRKFIQSTGVDTCDLMELPQLQELLKKPKKSYDVIIVELFTANCYLAFGKYMDTPVVVITASQMHDWLYGPFGNPLNPAYMSSSFIGYSQEMTFFERVKNTLSTYAIITLFNYYLDMERPQVEKYWGRKISSMDELYDDVSVILSNTHYSMGQIRPSTPDVIDIGGLHVAGTGQELSAEHKKWLDESTKGCIYVSFGSMVRIETLPADKLDAFYETFRRIAPVRVLMKIAVPKLLPPNLPKNVMVSTWLPQVAVLKHKNVKAFITHGGLMGTQESIAYGVPLVGIPVFGDQYTNLYALARKKIATVLDVKTFDANSLTKAVNEVLNNPEFAKNSKEIATLFMDRPQSPRETATYWVEYAARHGNRLRSPATKLTWYQYYLLDVYGLVLGSVLLVLYILKKIFGFIWACFCGRKSSGASMKSKKNK